MHSEGTGQVAGVDVGGTFTDCVLRAPEGLRAVKVRSSDAAPLEGIRRLLGLPAERNRDLRVRD